MGIKYAFCSQMKYVTYCIFRCLLINQNNRKTLINSTAPDLSKHLATTNFVFDFVDGERFYRR